MKKILDLILPIAVVALMLIALGMTACTFNVVNIPKAAAHVPRGTYQSPIDCILTDPPICPDKETPAP